MKIRHCRIILNSYSNIQNVTKNLVCQSFNDIYIFLKFSFVLSSCSVMRMATLSHSSFDADMRDGTCATEKDDVNEYKTRSDEW